MGHWVRVDQRSRPAVNAADVVGGGVLSAKSLDGIDKANGEAVLSRVRSSSTSEPGESVASEP